jgi:hypothetical protein
MRTSRRDPPIAICNRVVAELIQTIAEPPQMPPGVSALRVVVGGLRRAWNTRKYHFV